MFFASVLLVSRPTMKRFHAAFKRIRVTTNRNDLCPWGNARKHKRCCEKKEADLKRLELPSGR